MISANSGLDESIERRFDHQVFDTPFIQPIVVNPSRVQAAKSGEAPAYSSGILRCRTKVRSSGSSKVKTSARTLEIRTGSSDESIPRPTMARAPRAGFRVKSESCSLVRELAMAPVARGKGRL